MKNQTNRTLELAFVALLACGLIQAAALPASTLSGKVTGAKGVSVVYIEAIASKTFPAPAEKVVIDQKGLLFQPHVVAVHVGSTVEFLNSDKVAHNIFWPSVAGNKKMSHNLGTWPSGQKREFKFDTPGIVPLLCNVHPEMSAYVLVSPTPYFALSDTDGNYKITNLPDGQYTASAWHEGMKLQSKPVKVAGDISLDFTLSK
ncbi:MAG TPA: plastocyanin/azurin family copper-binding protein [Bryobacteraceae bacterium]|nr:plastocyanin/azurin family copper-binding protein [Bryobacteraceae bacterium]HXJ44057.1 plastocyanin/azurin family copper-binding protein [Bryobacteraceae bacterium]